MLNKKLRRNSQKRIYENHRIYFITTVTYKRYPYFQFNEYCKILWDDIFYAAKIKHFKLYGFVVISDHY